MLYDIKLHIRYDYARPSLGGRHILRLMPVDVANVQHVESCKLEISPKPDERIDQVDFFGNAVALSAFHTLHDFLDFKVSARVNRLALVPTLDMSPSLSLLPEEIWQYRDLDPTSPHHFLAGSARVVVFEEISSFARDSISNAISSQEAVNAINLALHAHMTFDPEATEVDTPMKEAFINRRGVCQDYAHIMIGCLRSLGIPAGYVSGFLRTVPPKGKPRLEGADAMHAWVQAWCGLKTGWVEFDPTNAVMVGQDHIVIARGRDYSDVSPIKGVFRAAGSQETTQAVDVIPLGEQVRAL